MDADQMNTNQILTLLVAVATFFVGVGSLWVSWRVHILSRKDRQEEKQDAVSAALQQKQDALTAALQGERQSIGFKALSLVHNPKLMNEANRTDLLTALCLAFVFETPSRTRALVVDALRNLSKDNEIYEQITSILNEVLAAFKYYDDAKMEGDEALDKYISRLNKLKSELR